MPYTKWFLLCFLIGWHQISSSGIYVGTPEQEITVNQFNPLNYLSPTWLILTGISTLILLSIWIIIGIKKENIIKVNENPDLSENVISTLFYPKDSEIDFNQRTSTIHTRILQKPLSPNEAAFLTISLVIMDCYDNVQIGKSIGIEKYPFRIGRASDLEFVINDRSISRLHAIIDRKDGNFSLNDEGSTNRIYVNGIILPKNGNIFIFPGYTIQLSPSTTLKVISNRSISLPNLIGLEIEGKYRLTKLKHTSERGVLYEAEEKSLKRNVGIKILSPNLSAFQGIKDQFNREAQVAANLQHPHICKIINYGSTNIEMNKASIVEITYVCTDLMKGDGLDILLKDVSNQIQLKEIVNWSVTLGSVFDYIHRQGVIHGGVKPSAIVFDQERKPYLTNFAFASSGDNDKQLMTGEPAYMAPEQWQAKKLSPAVDQFSFAVVLYMLISGELPYEHNGKEDEKARFRNFERGPIPVHEVAMEHGRFDVPKAVSMVISRALSIRPEDRYNSVGTFVLNLEKAITNKNIGGPKIFISYYRTENAIHANYIRDKFNEKFGISAFVDTQCVGVAGQLTDQIKNQIESCDVFVCLLASQTLKSKWVNNEILIASEIGKPMIPVFQKGFDMQMARKTRKKHIRKLLDQNGINLIEEAIDHSIATLAKIISQTVQAR
ncbi:MAG: protein kinase [Proteobacteria bacterium]|nr:protein kinase [Pseudomonadota bacterium]